MSDRIYAPIGEALRANALAEQLYNDVADLDIDDAMLDEIGQDAQHTVRLKHPHGHQLTLPASVLRVAAMERRKAHMDEFLRKYPDATTDDIAGAIALRRKLKGPWCT